MEKTKEGKIKIEVEMDEVIYSELEFGAKQDNISISRALHLILMNWLLRPEDY